MKKEDLVKEIIVACKYFEVIENNVEEELIDKNIINGLSDVCFVENLLSILEYKIKQRNFKNILDKINFKILMCELEKIRRELED